jgi:uncharacterized coiled-coil DUF342 family protein
MLPQSLSWAVSGGILATFALLVVLLLMQRRRVRRWQHEYDQLIANYHNLRDSHRVLREERDELLQEIEDLDERDDKTAPAADEAVTHARH